MDTTATDSHTATRTTKTGATAARGRARKLRVTTFLDRDVVMWLKVRALEERMGYQTLLNRFLREAIDRRSRQEPTETLKKRIDELTSRIEALERAQTAPVAAAPKLKARTRPRRPAKKATRSKSRSARK